MRHGFQDDIDALQSKLDERERLIEAFRVTVRSQERKLAVQEGEIAGLKYALYGKTKAERAAANVTILTAHEYAACEESGCYDMSQFRKATSIPI